MGERLHRCAGFCVAALTALFALAGPACSNATPDAALTPSAADIDEVSGESRISSGDFDPADFHDPTMIDNPWFPLPPGTRWVWEGRALDDGEMIERRVVFTVTDLTKVIGGVETVVTLDLDYNDGELGEADLAMLAQDDAGNVWQLGEYPEEYEGGEIVKAPAWIHGSQGAKAGIHMMSDPQLGSPDYAQGWGPKVGWNDRAETFALGTRACVPVDCYRDVLVIREFNPDEPGSFQIKHYAPGVGGILVDWAGKNEDEHEVLRLIEFRRLTRRNWPRFARTCSSRTSGHTSSLPARTGIRPRRASR